MKIRNLLFILIIIFSKDVSAQSDEVLVPYNAATMSKGLNININVGNIEIIGTDREDILVRYSFIEQSETNNEQITLNGLRRIPIRKSGLHIETRDEKIQISDSDFPSELDLYVEVPKNINIYTFKGGPGTLKIDNIKGNLNLENNAGSIVATQIEGIVNASTGNGGIKIEFLSLPKDYEIILANVAGDVEIDLPKEIDVSFQLKTNSGELLTNLDLDMKQSKSNSTKSSNSSGGFSYSNNTWTDAILNAGGPNMTLSSMNGNIIIRGF